MTRVILFDTIQAMRQSEKTNVMRILERFSIPYEALFYQVAESEGIDVVSVANRIQKPYECVFKTLVTRGDDHSYFVFVVPAKCDLDLKKAARSVGVKRVEMLPMKQLFPLTGYIHGGCSPIGMKKLFKTVIDDTALYIDEIYISAGKRGVSVSLKPQDLATLIQASFADISVLSEKKAC